MAAQQIPSGDRSLSLGSRGIGAGACARFEQNGAERVANSRRNGPVRCQFPKISRVRAGRRRMSPSARHIPVLGREAVEMLRPREGGVYVDATFGAGGHSRGILTIAGTRVIGIDRDRTAIAGGFDLVESAAGRLTLVEDRFSNLADICASQGAQTVDGVVMDVGVSSMQLDQPGRGFSFRLDGPLDMRMGETGPTAADVIAKASEAELADIIYIFGE